MRKSGKHWIISMMSIVNLPTQQKTLKS
ncbi:KxYKxGKxW signal peptide domain-containing protein [Bacillus infantis]